MTTPGDAYRRSRAFRAFLDDADPSDAPDLVQTVSRLPGRSAAAPGTPARSRARDEFTAFYRQRLPGLVVFLRYLGAEREDALDIAQETMRKAWERWKDLGDPAAWCRVVASRDLVDLATSREARNHSLEDLNRSGRGPSVLADAEALAEVESRHVFLRLVDGLPPRQRQVLAWTYDGATPEEIAAMLGLSPATVRSNLRHARTALRGLRPPEAGAR